MKQIAHISLFFLLIALSSGLQAAGVTTHMFMVDTAMSRIDDPELKKFLNEYHSAVLDGSIFPDSGYLMGGSYGEFAHWAPFHNAYMRYLDQTCSWPLNYTCERLFAFFLGNLSHGISDVIWHRDFVHEVAVHDFDGNREAADNYVDAGVDMLAMFDHCRFCMPDPFFPVADLEKIFQLAGNPADYNDLNTKTMMMYGIAIAERPGAVFTYPYYKLKARWTAENYYIAKGGVVDCATNIANLWTQVWSRLHQEHHFSSIVFDSSDGFRLDKRVIKAGAIAKN